MQLTIEIPEEQTLLSVGIQVVSIQLNVTIKLEIYNISLVILLTMFIVIGIGYAAKDSGSIFSNERLKVL